MISRTILALLAAAFISAPLAHAAVVEVQVANFTFTPEEVTVNQGDTVRWVWVSGSHTTTQTIASGSCTTMPDGWDSPITSANPTFEVQFDDLGELFYKCTPHCGAGMTGSVTVQVPPTRAPSLSFVALVFLALVSALAGTMMLRRRAMNAT